MEVFEYFTNVGARHKTKMVNVTIVRLNKKL